MLRCTRKSRGWFNWSQIVKICKNENFGFGIGPCVKPGSRNCTTEWLAPIVQPFPTTRTFSSTTIQQREPLWARYNNKNLFEHNNTTTSIIGRQVKSLWIGRNISWVHLGLNVINKHCLYQNTDCTLGVHCQYTTYFLLFTVQPCDYWQYTVCDVIFWWPRNIAQQCARQRWKKRKE